MADAKSFLLCDMPEYRGSSTIRLASSASKNILTVDRLHELQEALESVDKNPKATSRLLAAIVANDASPLDRPSPDGPVYTKDTKTISSGLAYDATAAEVSKLDEPDALQSSLNHVADAYYDLVERIVHLQKPTVTFSEGAVPRDAAYLFLWHTFVRVVTENAYLDMGLALGHAPMPPLLLLALCHARMAQRRPLVPGTDLYLAMAPPDMVRLRGPELLRVGLADVFVPETRVQDALTDASRLSACASADVVPAIHMALAAHHTYAGPDRLGVWEEEIKLTFGVSQGDG